MIKNSRILILGGAGFIGFHLSKTLSQEKLNNKIYLVDNFQRGLKDKNFKDLLKKKNVIFKNYDLTKKILLKNKNFDYVFQLSAIVGVKNVIRKSFDTLEKNVKIHFNCIEFCKKQKKLKKLIFFSTSEVFLGSLEKKKLKIPSPENNQIILPDLEKPRSSYMLSKIYCEALLHHSQLNFLILRPHNIYGERMGYSHVIPEIVNKIVKIKNFSEFKVDNIKHKRSFCYVKDAIFQIINLALSKKTKCNIFNIGNEKEEITIEILVKTLALILNKKIKLKNIVSNDSSPARRCPDMKKTKKIIGKLNYTSLKSGCKKYIKWYLNEKKL